MATQNALIQKITSWFSPPPGNRQAGELYITLVNQSRNPFFYTSCGVPDSLDGRFDMIILHMFLALSRYYADGSDASKEASRLLSEALFDDMDRNLREMGVSDTGVGKRMQKMVSAFYGRVDAYGKTIHDKEQLKEALKRNIYGTTENPSDAHVNALADYAIKNYTMIQALPADTLATQPIPFIQ